MVNIAHEVECSKGCKSHMHWGRAWKQSKWQGGWGDPYTEVSQTAVSVLTNSPEGMPMAKPHTEAIRSDEVSHLCAVALRCAGTCCRIPKPVKRGRNSRCGRNRYKDIHLTEGGLSMSSTLKRSQAPSLKLQRQRAEVIVVVGKRAPKAFREDSQNNEGLNVE